MFMWRLTGLAVLLTTLSSPAPEAAAAPDLAALTARLERIVRTSPGPSPVQSARAAGASSAKVTSSTPESLHTTRRKIAAPVGVRAVLGAGSGRALNSKH